MQVQALQLKNLATFLCAPDQQVANDGDPINKSCQDLQKILDKKLGMILLKDLTRFMPNNGTRSMHGTMQDLACILR